MGTSSSARRNRFPLILLATVATGLGVYLFTLFFAARLSEGPHTSFLKIPAVALWALLAYFTVRLVNAALFDFAFRIRRGYEAPTLVRNIFTLVIFTVLFVLIFKWFYSEINLGALFTTSAIFGVIIGLVSNSNAAKEAIEVAPRDNLNARLIFFSTVYTDSPAKTIHVVREAVRDADNVSEKITPIVRIRNLGESSIEWEIKYWLEDYAKYNDTDALVRQRTWYALRRNGLTFAFPTRTLHLERKVTARPTTAEDEIADRLSAVDVFAPLSTDELRQLAMATVGHVFAPGETLIRAGDEGSSMFVVHNGRVQVQLTESGKSRPVAVLSEGNFFGEMALFTGEPRTASVVALEETEVLEIGHAAMKHLFETNPSLVESISWTIAERRAGLAASAEQATPNSLAESAGLLTSIKRFFGLR